MMRTERKQSPTHRFPEEQSTVDLKKTRIWNLAGLIFWVELGVLKTQVDQAEEEQKGWELKGLLHLSDINVPSDHLHCLLGTHIMYFLTDHF